MLNKITKNSSSQDWKKILDQLVIENCLAFGDNSKLTQKKVARYLLGTRTTFEIFKLYELRYLLLKVYPFIQNLFYNPRTNSTLKTEKRWNPNYQKQLETQRKLGTRLPANQWKPRVRIINSFVQKEKNYTPQVLFATVTPMYTEIVKAAAQICNMPSHENRWLNGSITAAISYQEDHVRWNYITDEIQAQTVFSSAKKWGSNKENPEKTKEKLKYHGESRWPSLIIIPDLSQNIMILREAKKVGLPVMGLVNSSTSFEIDYPIFAQEQTLQSVHFFCHFLATLIAKEMVYVQHKRYILQKKKRKLKKKGVLKKKTFSAINKIANQINLRSKKTFKSVAGSVSKTIKPFAVRRSRKLKNIYLYFRKKKSRRRPFWRNTVFFRIVKPTNDRKATDKQKEVEYRSLRKIGPYFVRALSRETRLKFGLVKNWKKKSRFHQKSAKNVISSWSKEIKVQGKAARNFKAKRANPKVALRSVSLNRRRPKLGTVKKKRFPRKVSLVSLNSFNQKVSFNLRPSKRNQPKKVQKNFSMAYLKPRKKTQTYFKSLQPGRIVKVIRRYLKKQKKNVSLIKKQKYLNFFIKLQNEFRKNARRASGVIFSREFFQRKAFWNISDQRKLWKKINNFLVLKKMANLQTRNQRLRFQKAKFHTGYKNYYGSSLKQWQQVTRFQGLKYRFGIILNNISYSTRLAEALYYDDHPEEWKIEKARRYKLRSLEKNFKKRDWNSQKSQSKNQSSQNQNWAQWTEKNRPQKQKFHKNQPKRGRNEQASKRKTS